jgi:hypothetical protein
MAHFAYGKLSGKRYGKRHSKPYDTKRWKVVLVGYQLLSFLA